MKELFLAGVALCALTIGAQAAGADAGANEQMAVNTLSGDLSVFGGLFTLNNATPANDNTNGSIFGGEGRANIWMSPTLSLQFDLGAENYWDSFNGTYSIADLAGHVSQRSMPGHLLGAFGSLGYFGGYGDRLGTVGIEGQTYVGDVLFYGQAGYTGTISAPIPDNTLNAWYVHGEARYFFNPNLMLSVNGGYARANEPGESPPEPHDLYRWGADLEWKAADKPFGAFISYQGALDHEPSSGAGNPDFTVNTVLAGLKFYFNDQSLKSRSDTGATLKDFNPFTGVNNVPFFDWN